MEFCRILNIDFLVFLLNLFVPQSIGSNAEKSLKAVVMLTRHGDRSPGRTYPLDPYKDFPWPGGFGSLTPEGYMQMFQSGQIKSSRYRSLLFDAGCRESDCDVNTRKMYVLSSAVPRCIASATSFLIAFVGKLWSPDLLRVVPQAHDEMLAEPGKPCKKYGSPSLFPFGESQWNIIRSFSGNEPLPIYIEKHTAMPFRVSIDAHRLYDTLSVELDHGLSIPSWADDIFSKYIRPLGILSFQMLSSSSYLRTRSGVLLNDIVNRLEKFTVNDTAHSVILYSAHDVTIAGMTYNLGLINQTELLPKYGAMLCLELHQGCMQCKDSYEIKVMYYQNFSSVEPLEVELPGCESPCKFSSFKKIVGPMLINSYDQTCLN